MIKPAAVLFALALCGACADTWDNHYGDGGTGMPMGGSLWETLEADGNLTHFTRVVKECGYDVVLDGTQTYTVFAPTDSRFTSHMADSVIELYKKYNGGNMRRDDNPAIRQFLQNHIALYKKPVSTLTQDTLVMMNGKYQMLTADAVGSEKLLSTNTLCGNGMLFTVSAPLDYNPNVFEYLGIDSELDSVYNFLSAYNIYEFQPEKSVAGGIVDGKTVYLDSVVELRNSLLNTLGLINSEDSSYWMLAPTNQIWEEKLAEYEPYFNYSNVVKNRDSLQFVNTRLAVIGGAIFNRSENPDEAFRDSACSTQAQSYEMRKYMQADPYYIFYRPFDAGGIFDGTEDVVCSNGHVRKASDYRIDKYNTFLQTVKVEAEYSSSQDTVLNAETPLTVRTVSESNPFYGKVSGNAYVDVEPKAELAPDKYPQLTLSVPGLVSNVGYDIYVVFAPVLATDPLASEYNRLPNYFSAAVSYVLQSGAWSRPFQGPAKATQRDVVDTVLVASNRVFPVSSMGMSQAQVKLNIISRVTASQTSLYSRTMHIDCVLFVPHRDDSEE